MPARLGDPVRVLDENAEDHAAAIVCRADPEQTIEPGDGLLNYPYDIYPVGVRLLPDGGGDLPHLPLVHITAWESDARALAGLDTGTRYGWYRDGQRPL